MYTCSVDCPRCILIIYQHNVRRDRPIYLASCILPNVSSNLIVLFSSYCVRLLLISEPVFCSKMILLIWGFTIVAAFCLYCYHLYSRFSRHGVKGPTPVPLFGTFATITLRLDHATEYIERTYNMFPNERFYSSFEFLRPVAVIKDLDLIKNITVKDFDHFVDHRPLFADESDPFFGRNLLSMKGQVWRDMRSTLSPAFTSSKIRAMVPFMVEVGDQMIEDLKRKIKESNTGSIDVITKELVNRYANDVIATCAFGIKVDSYADQNNQFYVMAKSFTTFGLVNGLKFLAMLALPMALKKYVKLSIFSEEAKAFYRELVLGSMKEREMNHIHRPDMIHLLMEAKKGSLTHDISETKDQGAGFATVDESSVGKKQPTRAWTDNDLIPQAVLFLFAGFETVSSMMTFLLVELALNPDVQEKLLEEIKDNDQKNGGKFDYNSIQSMTYMDMVVSELMRLWTPVPGIDRLCVKDYNLGKPHEYGQDFWLRKGETVSVPIWAIHRNPEYFPNPTKFDPERFSPENQHNIKPFTYMPFGLGPRNCIGSRFALCEVKVMVYQLLQNFELTPSKKLQIPIVLSKKTFNMRIKGDEWVQMKIRNC